MEAQIFSSAAINVGPSPEIVSRLMRAVAPAAIETSRGGTPTDLAISLQSAALASPSLGGGPHPRFQHAAAIGQLVDTIYGVAAAFRRQANIEHNTGTG